MITFQVPRPIRHAFILLVVLAALALAVIYLVPHYVWHPLTGLGYQFWSGIAGSFLTSLPGWTAAICIYWRHNNCHYPGCWGLQWHPHPDHEHPVCRAHHPHSDADHPVWAAS